MLGIGKSQAFLQFDQEKADLLTILVEWTGRNSKARRYRIGLSASVGSLEDFLKELWEDAKDGKEKKEKKEKEEKEKKEKEEKEKKEKIAKEEADDKKKIEEGLAKLKRHETHWLHV